MSQGIKLNREELDKEFKVLLKSDKPNKLTHSAGSDSSAFRIFPYTASSSNGVSDYNAVVGEYSRRVTERSYHKFEKASFLKKVQEQVTTDFPEKLHGIINELFFDDDDQLILSHPSFFNYLPTGSNKEQKVGQFLSAIFFDETITKELKQAYKKQPTNMLLSLIFSSLESLGEQVTKKSNYPMLIPEILQLFKEDLLFLLESDSLFVKHYKQLLIYYYFFYTSQVILNLDKMFKIDEHSIIPVYFKVDWESPSKTRESYKQGWKMIASKLPKLFAHINCVMMLSHIQSSSSEEPMTYVTLKKIVKQMQDTEKKDLNQDLEDWHKTYRSCLDVNWEAASRLPNVENEEPILTEVRSLQHSIAYQFQPKVSTRDQAAKRYYEGYDQLAKKHFLKKSGPLGYTLNLKKEFIIFLTKLCLKKSSRISLKELFHELQRRGIFFDRDSKKQIVSLYEQLNILEKKSDSGDAQYVKYIL